ncbi:hypothetical protein Agabi119p4_6192 [Agaricus bisporus var. burnettii]|uniref:Uncharacterized protein n=1 Tax=Agaricus bisporus var. burnettii TaxID=192524 RepID=A0A8H7C9C3_AGABI|nr:hypothetical protein Agabi119p4_6192 [Agaricus bisporus var. burnettii]
MTEYDYSPEAYERYVSRQQAIARWVDDTSLYTPANPFVPLPGASPPTTYRPQDRGPDVNFERSSSSRPLGYSYGKDDGHRSRPGRHDRHRSRKQSAPTPATYIYSSQPAYGYGVQQQVPYGQGQYHYRSTSAQYNSPYDSSSRTPTASPPPRSASKSQPNQPIVIAIKGGNTGHFPGRQKGVSYQVHPQHPQPVSTTQPWYKRVFSPTADSNGGKNKISKTPRDSNGRSSKSRWSLDIY